MLVKIRHFHLSCHSLAQMLSFLAWQLPMIGPDDLLVWEVSCLDGAPTCGMLNVRAFIFPSMPYLSILFFTDADWRR